MNISNPEKRYSGLSTLNHWVTVVLVVAMLTLGLAAGEAPEPAEHYIMELHFGLGFFVLLFVIWRSAYRIAQGFPVNPSADALERVGAWWMHRLLLLTLILLVVTGPLYLFTEGEGIDVFGWFTFYIPLEGLAFMHEPAEEVHKFLGEYALPVLIILHFAGAARHYLWGARRSLADL